MSITLQEVKEARQPGAVLKSCRAKKICAMHCSCSSRGSWESSWEMFNSEG